MARGNAIGDVDNPLGIEGVEASEEGRLEDVAMESSSDEEDEETSAKDDDMDAIFAKSVPDTNAGESSSDESEDESDKKEEVEQKIEVAVVEKKEEKKVGNYYNGINCNASYTRY